MGRRGRRGRGRTRGCRGKEGRRGKRIKSFNVIHKNQIQNMVVFFSLKNNASSQRSTKEKKNSFYPQKTTPHKPHLLNTYLQLKTDDKLTTFLDKYKKLSI